MGSEMCIRDRCVVLLAVRLAASGAAYGHERWPYLAYAANRTQVPVGPRWLERSMRSHLCWCGVEAVESSFESLKGSSLPMGASPASARAAAPRAIADSADVVSADLSASSMGLPAAGPAHLLLVGRPLQRAL